MSRAESANGKLASLRNRVTCPHCWTIFATEDILWVSEHADLMGDERLGPEAPRRFLPSRFTVDGNAIDSRGSACHTLACPHCHLSIPRALLEFEPLFVSILGAPASGKSYFLAAMTWQLRQSLPKWFGLAFGDADPASNVALAESEELLFLNTDVDRLVTLRKTELQGDLYDQVRYGDQTVIYPRPYVFSLRPLDHHPSVQQAAKASRVLCLYDNAGEHFLPGADQMRSPVTRHLARSRFLMFLYDPTQDPRFRRLCGGAEHADPQISQPKFTIRQDTLLDEAADRVRRHSNLGAGQRHNRPLIVVVTKFDAWAKLLDNPPSSSEAFLRRGSGKLCGFDPQGVQDVSVHVRELLWQHCPEVVSAAEGFAEQVVYIPVSATGRGPQFDAERGVTGFRPEEIQPSLAELPLVYALCRWESGLVPYVKKPGATKAENKSP